MTPKADDNQNREKDACYQTGEEANKYSSRWELITMSVRAGGGI